MRVWILISKTNIAALLFSALLLMLMLHESYASYTIQNLNVTVQLNQNTSAQVTEVLHVMISNQSVSQYNTNRIAFNLTLSEWQTLIGPLLVQHILSPSYSVYNFKLLPGPAIASGNGGVANITMEYGVKNVTFVNETGPRTFQYVFNPKVFNFEHGASGEVLLPNTTLTIDVPQGGKILSAYPIPDLPQDAITTDYRNVTSASWKYGEPLSKFTLIFQTRQSLEEEVLQFFGKVYSTLGLFTYLIIIVVAALFILYVYRRAVL